MNEVISLMRKDILSFAEGKTLQQFCLLPSAFCLLHSAFKLQFIELGSINCNLWLLLPVQIFSHPYPGPIQDQVDVALLGAGKIHTVGTSARSAGGADFGYMSTNSSFR